MDSKQLVNDIVNKRLSKARKSINEELSNRVLNHIETRRSDVINEALSFEPGVAKAAVAGVAAAGLAGAGIVKGVKALHKRFGAKGRADKKAEKEGKKKDKAEAKKNLAWMKGPGKKVKKLESKLHKPGRGVELTDKEKNANQKIQDQIDDIRDNFDSDWAKSHKKDVKAGRIEAGPGKSAKKQKKAARSERDKEQKVQGIAAKAQKEVDKLTDKLKVAPEGGTLSDKDIEHNKQIKRDIEDVANKANKVDKEGQRSVKAAREKEDALEVANDNFEKVQKDVKAQIKGLNTQLKDANNKDDKDAALKIKQAINDATKKEHEAENEIRRIEGEDPIEFDPPQDTETAARDALPNAENNAEKAQVDADNKIATAQDANVDNALTGGGKEDEANKANTDAEKAQAKADEFALNVDDIKAAAGLPTDDEEGEEEEEEEEEEGKGE